MKKFTVQVIVLLIVAFVALAFYTSKITINPFLPSSPAFKQVTINGSTLKVELADTQDKRTKGLSGRDSLASDSGMLFTFANPDKYPFWMKGIKFPLDFIWIRNNVVVDFIENVEPPKANQSDSSLPVYSSKVPIDSVLEVNAGIVKSLKIKEGDKVSVTD